MMNDALALNLALSLGLIVMLVIAIRRILRQVPLPAVKLERDPEANTGSPDAQLTFYMQMQDGKNSIVIRNMGPAGDFTIVGDSIYVIGGPWVGMKALREGRTELIGAGEYTRCYLPALDLAYGNAFPNVLFIDVKVTALNGRWQKQRYRVDQDGIESYPYKVPA